MKNLQKSCVDSTLVSYPSHQSAKLEQILVDQVSKRLGLNPPCLSTMNHIRVSTNNQWIFPSQIENQNQSDISEVLILEQRNSIHQSTDFSITE